MDISEVKQFIYFHYDSQYEIAMGKVWREPSMLGLHSGGSGSTPLLTTMIF